MAAEAALAGLPPLRRVIAAHQLSARRSLGQNFLLDLNVTRRIAKAAGPLAGATVIEAGPGPGGLTRALLEQGAARVIAVERDRRCVGALREVAAAAGGRLEVVEGDVLAADPAALAGGRRPVRAVANPPYNIATALLAKWLDAVPPFDRLVLMFQKEVADRLLASPGTGAYGRLSVAAQWRCDVRRLFDLPPQAFVPQPKVRSSVVALEPLPAPRADAEPAMLRAVTAAGFGQRRKMLRSSLADLFARPRATLSDCGIDPSRRAGEIGVDGWCALARALAEERRRGPVSVRRADS